MKVCKRCLIKQPLSNYYPKKNGKLGVSSECRDCFKKRIKLYRQTDKGKDAHKSNVERNALAKLQDTLFRINRRLTKYLDKKDSVIKQIRHYRIKRDTLNTHSERRLITHYGITLKDYNDLLEKQNFACAICKQDYENFERKLCVDHDHDTGEVRGLLCVGCNRGLGFLGDKLENLQNATSYLKKSKKAK